MHTVDPRSKVIKGITTGFAFFALVVLVTEGLLVYTAVQIGAGTDRTFLVVSCVSLLTLLSLIVALLLYFKPWVLTGDPPPPIVIQQLTPPAGAEIAIRIQYFLRGIREYYIHVLADAKLALPQHVRLNVMLVLSSTAKKSKDKVLQIKYMDYPGLFTNDELLQEYPRGTGNCGEAWRLNALRAWASDLPDAKRVDMKEVSSPNAQHRNSVLSVPILCSGECIGVLNLDSEEDSRTTNVHLPMVHNLMAEGAREIVPLFYLGAKEGGENAD